MFLSPFKYIRYNFTFDFFQKKSINPLCEYVHNKANNKGIFNKNFNPNNSIGEAIHEIRFIPPYFDVKFPFLASEYEVMRFCRVDNFQINLEGYSDAEEYLKSRMGPKSRSQLRRRINGLEACFKINYTFYFGELSKEKYDFLFEKLELLIERRFRQRGDIFTLKSKLESIKENSYELILEKKASFFVIYDGEKPIDICLSYHFQNIILHLIRSYDIDYSKFGLGQIDILKQVEWCIEKGIKIFDLMWGELVYKTRWCNVNRLYEHYFIYKNNHLLKKAFIRLMIKLYKINDFLKQKRISQFPYKLRVAFSKKNQSMQTKKEYAYKIENIAIMPCYDSITKININCDEYAFLRKPTYDFQYLNFEASDTIHVFKMNNDSNSYIIKGEKQQQNILVSIN